MSRPSENWLASLDRGRESSFSRHTQFSVDPRISNERRAQLHAAFGEIDKDKSGKLSFAEILAFLKSVSKETDETQLQQTFQSMDRNNDGAVSIEEFIDFYLDGVNQIADRVTKLQQYVSERRREQAKLQEQLEEAQKIERINEWGIMEGSILQVKVLEAQNITGLTGTPSAFVTLLCERQQISTKIVKNNSNPVWNESFSFRVTAGNGDLVVQVFNQGTLTKDDPLGSCAIPLPEFKDQARHERCFHLTGRSTSARIMLEVQWIHRKTVYLDGLIREIEEDVSKVEGEVEDLQAQLRRAGTDPLGMFSKDNWLTRLEGRVLDEVKDLTDAYFTSVSSWAVLQRILLAIFVLLVILMSLSRTDLFNATWGSYMISREIRGFSLKELKFAAVALACLIVSDFVWIADDFELLVFEVHNDPLINLERFCFIIAFFNFLLKLLLFPVIVTNYRKRKG